MEKSGQSRSQCTDTETIFTLCVNEFECCSYWPLDNHGCENENSRIQPPIGNLIYLEAEGPHHLIRTNPYLVRENPCVHTALNRQRITLGHANLSVVYWSTTVS